MFQYLVVVVRSPSPRTKTQKRSSEPRSGSILIDLARIEARCIAYELEQRAGLDAQLSIAARI